MSIVGYACIALGAVIGVGGSLSIPDPEAI